VFPIAKITLIPVQEPKKLGGI